MPNPALSPAIIEARNVCPTNVFEIETLEIRHPDVFIQKKLQVCVVIDLWANNSTNQAAINRIIGQLDEINSDLLETYKSIQWSLVTIAGQTWTFETGYDFVSFADFIAEAVAVTPVVNTTAGKIYDVLEDVALKLNWYKSSPYSEDKHILYIGDTRNFETSPVEWISDFEYNDVSLSGINYAEIGASLSVSPWSSGTFQLKLFYGDPVTPTVKAGDKVLVSGFTNPANNGLFCVGGVYTPTAGNPHRYTLGLTQPSFYANTLTGTTWSSEGTINGGFPATGYSRPVGMTLEAKADISVVGVNHTIYPTSYGNPTDAIAALQEKGIVFHQMPSFVNADLTSVVTSTDGGTITLANLANDGLVRTNVVNLFGSQEVISSGLDSIFIVNDTRPHELPLVEGGETVEFVTRGFKLRQVGSGENGLQSLGITIDDIDRKVSQFVARTKQYQSPVELVFRVYLSDDLTRPQNDPPTTLFLSASSKNAEGFSATCSTIDVVNHPFPNAYYRLQNFPLQ